MVRFCDVFAHDADRGTNPTRPFRRRGAAEKNAGIVTVSRFKGGSELIEYLPPGCVNYIAHRRVAGSKIVKISLACPNESRLSVGSNSYPWRPGSPMEPTGGQSRMSEWVQGRAGLVQFFGLGHSLDLSVVKDHRTPGSARTIFPRRHRGSGFPTHGKFVGTGWEKDFLSSQRFAARRGDFPQIPDTGLPTPRVTPPASLLFQPNAPINKEGSCF